MKNAVLIMILLCEVWGISYAGWRNVPRSMMFYTQLSNAAAFFSALALLCLGSFTWVTAFRYLSVCMLMMTMFVTIFILVPAIKDTRLLLWSRAGFFTAYCLSDPEFCQLRISGSTCGSPYDHSAGNRYTGIWGYHAVFQLPAQSRRSLSVSACVSTEQNGYGIVVYGTAGSDRILCICIGLDCLSAFPALKGNNSILII